MTQRYLIVGLGNPGKEYETTRHNIGFVCVDALAAQHGLRFAKMQNRALIADGTICERRVLLAKPQTYMNLSGEAVRDLLSFYKLSVRELLVISDDLDIPFETLRIREKGSAGGQRGLKNIIDHLGTQEFARIRFGIGRPPGRMDAAAYVLQSFSKAESEALPELIGRAIKACEIWLSEGLTAAMNKFNGGAGSAEAAKVKPAAQPATPPKTGQDEA
jgi:PTH1 family peptidyl-tRNA hydrolase